MLGGAIPKRTGNLGRAVGAVKSLTLSNDTNKAALVSTVFNYSIKNNHKTEDINEVTCMISSITETIVAIRDHKQNPLPDEYIQHITSIHQTTSVAKFNRTAAELEDDVTYSHRFWKLTMSTGVRNHKGVYTSSSSSQLAMENTLDSYKLVFPLANEAYREHKHDGEWNKALRHDVDNGSAMVNDPTHPSGNNTCWNCREFDCDVLSCPKPKDAAQVAANRKLFYHQKQQDREGTLLKHIHKTPKSVPFACCLPKSHQNNKRVIHGHPHMIGYIGSRTGIMDASVSKSSFLIVQGLHGAGEECAEVGPGVLSNGLRVSSANLQGELWEQLHVVNTFQNCCVNVEDKPGII